MKKPLRTFYAFANSVFPTEVEHVKNNNEITDPELISILDTLHNYVLFPEKEVRFNDRIDARKYSRIIKYFETKLERIDVDAYYAWVTQIDFQITTDAIPPQEQQRILNEIKTFEPGWFHAASFYTTMQNYKRYLLVRYREKDYEIVDAFLHKHQADFEKNIEIQNRIDALTANFVTGQSNKPSQVEKDLQWLLDVFYDEGNSKKNRYQALVAYNIYHITARHIDPMLAPMAALEDRLLKGEFYSRRILSNFYANKLLLKSYEGEYETAAYCGLQSIKHYTEDYLYYLNNYSSVLMNLNRFYEVLQHSETAMDVFKQSQDNSRKVIFMANYCRCLNNFLEYRKTMRYSRRLLDELGDGIFRHKWHFFFRIYFVALIQENRHDELLRLERRYKLTEREEVEGFSPFLKLYTLAAGYFEMRLPKQRFAEELQNLRPQIEDSKREDLKAIFKEVERLG